MSEDMPVENCEPVVPADVPEEVGGLLVAESRNIPDEPLPQFRGGVPVAQCFVNTVELFPQRDRVARLRPVEPNVVLPIGKDRFRIELLLPKAGLPQSGDGAFRVLGARLRRKETVQQLVEVFPGFNSAELAKPLLDFLPAQRVVMMKRGKRVVVLAGADRIQLVRRALSVPPRERS